jgi:uncharacterized protein YndB with AHSA1/START domain
MMALDVDQLVVGKSVVVEASQERAFEVFTAEFNTWWPESHHTGPGTPSHDVIEPRVGGRIYEVSTDGVETDWGRVLAWEPPARLVWAWMLNEQYTFDPDESRATEIEVLFVAEGPKRTRVELEHRGFERMGDAGAILHEGVSGEGGWGTLLERYTAVIAAEASA